MIFQCGHTGLDRSRRRTFLFFVGAVMAILATMHAVGQTAAATSRQQPAAVAPMAADAHPSFAVATIKPHDPDSHHQGFNAVGDRFTIRNQTITGIMMFAYSLNQHQVAGLPEWAGTARYDIEGTVDTPGEPSLRQQQEMLQKILAERFQLKFHKDKRELSAYAIQLAKGGPRLTAAANPDAQPDQEGDGHGTEMTQVYTSASMADFVLGMQFFLDRPLVNQTGLTGRYDFKLRYTYDVEKTTDPNAPPGLFTAVQEQLGLKFEPVKAPVDVYVIDQIERPSAD
jgi:uncharacterized protein (TIGR03435 family)